MDREQYEELSGHERESGDFDYINNPVSADSRCDEQKPISGFVCVFVVVLLFMFLVGRFFESLLKIAVFSLQNFWVLFVFVAFFICSRILYPKKIDQDSFINIFNGEMDDGSTVIENMESNEIRAKGWFCLLIDVVKLVFCLAVLLIVGIVIFFGEMGPGWRVVFD